MSNEALQWILFPLLMIKQRASSNIISHPIMKQGQNASRFLDRKFVFLFDNDIHISLKLM
jgi:hypothetical protein